LPSISFKELVIGLLSLYLYTSMIIMPTC